MVFEKLQHTLKEHINAKKEANDMYNEHQTKFVALQVLDNIHLLYQCNWHILILNHRILCTEIVK